MEIISRSPENVGTFYDTTSAHTLYIRFALRRCTRVPKVNVAGLLIFHLFGMQCVCHTLCAVHGVLCRSYDECACKIKRNKEMKNKKKKKTGKKWARKHIHSPPSHTDTLCAYIAYAEHGRWKSAIEQKDGDGNSYFNFSPMNARYVFSRSRSLDAFIRQLCSIVFCTRARSTFTWDHLLSSR